MKRYLILFMGQVQGVGFRWTCLQVAKKYNLTGNVRNLEFGSVQAEVQGEMEAIDAFLSEVMMPRHFILVQDYSLKEIPLKDEREFEVIA